MWWWLAHAGAADEGARGVGAPGEVCAIERASGGATAIRWAEGRVVELHTPSSGVRVGLRWDEQGRLVGWENTGGGEPSRYTASFVGGRLRTAELASADGRVSYTFAWQDEDGGPTAPREGGDRPSGGGFPISATLQPVVPFTQAPHAWLYGGGVGEVRVTEQRCPAKGRCDPEEQGWTLHYAENGLLRLARLGLRQSTFGYERGVLIEEHHRDGEIGSGWEARTTYHFDVEGRYRGSDLERTGNPPRRARSVLEVAPDGSVSHVHLRVVDGVASETGRDRWVPCASEPNGG